MSMANSNSRPEGNIHLALDLYKERARGAPGVARYVKAPRLPF
jgi:hypothetical protein